MIFIMKLLLTSY